MAKRILMGGALFAVLAVAALCGLRLSVFRQAEAAAEEARATYPGNGVEALMAQLSDETAPLAARNHAVWALGQLGDARAIPALEAAYSGGECDHQHGLCQYELKKALGQCRGESWDLMFWRHGHE